MLDHADSQRGFLVRKAFFHLTHHACPHSHPPSPPQSGIIGDPYSKMLAQQRPIYKNYSWWCQWSLQCSSQNEIWRLGDRGWLGDTNSCDWIQSMSYIRYLLKYKDEVRCWRVISPQAFQILSPVSHYAMPFYLPTPFPSSTKMSWILPKEEKSS